MNAGVDLATMALLRLPDAEPFGDDIRAAHNDAPSWAERKLGAPETLS